MKMRTTVDQHWEGKLEAEINCERFYFLCIQRKKLQPDTNLNEKLFYLVLKVNI